MSIEKPDIPTDIPTTASDPLVAQLESASVLGAIPELQNFSMDKDFSKLSLGHPIPDTLFCTMANIFGYMLDLEQKQQNEET
ncbi:MAG: hypothetical protein COA96_05035 [SAR86 cluster bacterium]|uniref:Uncharacterized protein n=1 Tax=SAR86 cluster bacterium TaxID=2030880 RepID=A0A2A5B5E0_9GAMM|nr:MAG: hypothetical protein COA96_05035 [SAR86 cluster bacterium]